MSSEWASGNLGDFIELKRGYDLPQAKRLPGSVPLVSSSGVTDQHSVAMVKGPGVVTGRYGTIGQVFYVEADFWPLNTTLYVRDFKGNDPKFVHYFLKTLDFLAYSDKGAVPGVNRNHLHEAHVTVPPLSVQIELGHFLGALDDRITLLRETNATLEAIAQALFKSWFVDFDPVRAKMEGRAPEGMDEATAALFPDGFEESALEAMPRGWRLMPFGELLTHTIGGDWGSDVSEGTNDTRVAIIRGTDIPDLQSGAVSRVPVRYTSSKKLATRRLEHGDLVLEVSGGSKDQPTGRSLYLTKGLLAQFDCPVEPASFCRLLRPCTYEVGVLLAQHLTYIYAQGKTWEYQNQSTGIANFQTAHFLATELAAIPPEGVLAAFAEVVRPLIDRTHLTQIKELATLRDTLLPRLISGQLRLPEAAALIKEVNV
jgi:type I restriction enzyme S subunit